MAKAIKKYYERNNYLIQHYMYVESNLQLALAKPETLFCAFLDFHKIHRLVY